MQKIISLSKLKLKIASSYCHLLIKYSIEDYRGKSLTKTAEAFRFSAPPLSLIGLGSQKSG